VGKILKLGIVLFIITAVTGLLLGGVYTITLEPIKIAKRNEKNEAMAQTLPDATAFESVPVAADADIITDINKGIVNGETVGWNYTVEPKGYGGLIEIIVGVSKDGRLQAVKILSHSETPGLGAKAAEEPFIGQFRGKQTGALAITQSDTAAQNEIQAISGATITSGAVVQGVNAALAYFGEHQHESERQSETPAGTGYAGELPEN